MCALALVCMGSGARAQARSGVAATPNPGFYVVAHGDTLSTIAARLGVTSRSLAERNHLEPPYALRPGRTLRVPGTAPTTAPVATPGRTATEPRRPEPARGTPAANNQAAGGGRWGRPRVVGLVRLVREHNDEQLAINLRRITRHSGRRMEHFLRFPDGRHHAMNPRLLRQLAAVSDHFGGRRIRVVSGFRPFRSGQWTPHSNHNIGAAVDFRVEGVPNRTLRDFCRSFPQTGCGFYPRSVFVHMDVRTESATWVDWSRPGQRPMYGREDRAPDAHAPPMPPPPGAPADESVDDVADDSATVRSAPPPTDTENNGGEGGGAADAPLPGAGAP